MKHPPLKPVGKKTESESRASETPAKLEVVLEPPAEKTKVKKRMRQKEKP